jgi:hypothetical protein
MVLNYPEYIRLEDHRKVRRQHSFDLNALDVVQINGPNARVGLCPYHQSPHVIVAFDIRQCLGGVHDDCDFWDEVARDQVQSMKK